MAKLEKATIFWLIIIIILFMVCRGCTHDWESRMQSQPLNVIALIPHAIGRYSIGFPDGAILINWSQELQGLGKIKVTRNVSQEEMERMVNLRAASLQSVPHKRGGTRFENIVHLQIPNSQSVLYWPNHVSAKEKYLRCDTYHLKKDILYEVEVFVGTEPKDQESDLHGLEETLRSIRCLQPNEIPREPGSCFDGTMLMDAPGREYGDMIAATIVWPDRPDVRFEFFISDNGDRPDPPLLTRLKRANAIPLLGVLRSGPRVVGGIPGEEELERVTENNGTVSHLFIWEAQGLPNRYDHPQIRLDMSTGHGKDAPIYSTLSDEDALKLWDAVLESLHWRPTVPPTQAGPRDAPVNSGPQT